MIPFQKENIYSQFTNPDLEENEMVEIPQVVAMDLNNSCIICSGMITDEKATFICSHIAHLDCLGFLKYAAEGNPLMSYTCLKCRDVRTKWKIFWNDEDRKIKWIDRVYLLNKQKSLLKEGFVIGEEKITPEKLSRNKMNFDMIFKRGIRLSQIFYEFNDRNGSTYKNLGLKLSHFKTYKDLANINEFLTYCNLTWYSLKTLYPKCKMQDITSMDFDFNTLKLLNLSFDSLLIVCKDHNDFKNLKLTLSQMVESGATQDLSKKCLGSIMEVFSRDSSGPRKKKK